MPINPIASPAPSSTLPGVGSLVTHRTQPAWGVGQVTAAHRGTPPRVSVRFADAERTFAVMPPPLEPAPEGSTPPKPLSAVRARKTGAGAVSSGGVSSNYATLEAALAKFKAEMPAGFADPLYAKLERDDKWSAHQKFAATLGGSPTGCAKGRDLLTKGTPEAIEELTSLLLSITRSEKYMSIFEKAAITDALRAPQDAAAFATAFFDLIEDAAADNTIGGREPAFTRYCEVLANLPAQKTKVSTWPTATTLPGLARPDLFPILKPSVTRNAAGAWLGGMTSGKRINLNYTVSPNWLTYRQFTVLSRDLLDLLRPIGAIDFIDVQSFIWVVEHYHRTR